MTDRYWEDFEGPPGDRARLLRPLGTALVRAAWSVRIHGREHVPATGPVILAANHIGFLDGPLLYSVMHRPVHAIVKQEMFRGLVGRALLALGQISTDRLHFDPHAVKSALAVLHREDVLAIYPEGTRGSGDFAEMRPGVAYLALCTGAPIIPVACLGTRAAGKSIEAIPELRSRLDVVFGPPVTTEPVPWPRRRHVVRAEAVRLRDRLVAHVHDAIERTGRSLP